MIVQTAWTYEVAPGQSIVQLLLVLLCNTSLTIPADSVHQAVPKFAD